MEEKLTKKEALKIRKRFQLLALAAALVITIGTVFMHYVEKLSWLDAFYFSVVSLTTVGYGDITPRTNEGKIFIIFYLLIGIGIVATFATNLLRNALAGRVIRKNK